MKLKILIFLLFSSLFIFSNDFLKPGPSLIVVIMIKNEAPVIKKTLETYLAPGVGFVVFDTGSIDGTQQLVQEFFAEHNLEHAHLCEEPFIDFSTSRNHALDAAEQLFPDATFMLMPDAEWYMQNMKGLLQFCEQEEYATTAVYELRITDNCSLDFFTPRLIRCKTKSRFKSVVHESLFASEKVPDDIFFLRGSSDGGREKSAQRWQRDLILLFNEHQKNPNDTRTVFYLAQTFECLGDLDNAYYYYKLRSDMHGWEEELYETFYRLGRIAEARGKWQDKDKWPQAFAYYCAAFAKRPHRAEPLIKIAEHYWPNNIPLCYLFARRATELPYPKNDRLFVEKIVYDYTRYDTLSKSAWYVGEYELGEWATLLALKKLPNAPHLLNNLKLYQQKLNKVT